MLFYHFLKHGMTPHTEEQTAVDGRFEVKKTWSQESGLAGIKVCREPKHNIAIS